MSVPVTLTTPLPVMLSATTVVYEYLTANLGTVGFTGVKAYGRIPPQRPKRFVRVRTVGGGADTVSTTNPTVTIESYAGTESEAEMLAEACHYLMRRADERGWLGAVPCRSVEAFSRLAALPDPLTPDQGRFTATYSLRLRVPFTN